MFKKYLFLALFPILSFGQDFNWVRQIKGIVYDYSDFAVDATIDSNGSTYVVGRTESPLFDLDPTAGGTEIVDHTTVQNFAGTYLVKVDIDGNYMWGVSFGNYPRGDNAYSVKVGADGNIYVLLTLMDYNSTTSIIDSYITIIKLSPSGTTLFTKTIKQGYGGFNVMNVSSLDLDSQNNMLITGYFVGSLTIDSTNLNLNAGSTWGIGNYVLKINPSGNIIWVKQLNISTPCLDNKLIVRPDGNINLLALTGSDYALIDLNNSDGSIIWQKDFINQKFVTFHVSPFGIIILGEKLGYTDIIDVDPSSGVSSISSNCNFIIFLDLSGAFEEVKIYERDPNGDLKFTAVTTDANGKYYFGGFFGTGYAVPTTIDFNASSGVSTITTPGSAGFYLKMDQNKNFESVLTTGTNYSYLIRNINVLNDDMYVTGEFMWLCDFDPSPASSYFLNTLNGGTVVRDGFILKLGACDSLTPNALGNQIFCSSEHPTISNLSPNSIANRWYSSFTSTTHLLATTPLINGQTYYVSKQIGSCPESPRQAVNVTINPSPSSPVVTIQSFCDSDLTTLSSLSISGSNLIFYDALVGGNILPANTLLVNSVTYYVTQTVNNCESPRAAINIPIIPSTTPTITTPQKFCFQQNATLNDIIITGTGIKWYDASTSGNVLANTNLLQDGITYYASQTSSGCESIRVPVTIQIQNTAAPTGTNQSFCATQNATLNDIIVSGTGVQWYSSVTNATQLPTNTILSDNTTYYATQMVNGCESITRLPITTSLIYSLNATDGNAFICDNQNDGSEIVDLSILNYLMTSLTGNTFTYYASFNGADNQIASQQLPTNLMISLGQTIVYVRIDNINGCHQVVELELTLVSIPIIIMPDEFAFCEGSSVTISAPSGFDLYVWSTNVSSTSITVNQAGNYWLMVGNNYGNASCTSIKKFYSYFIKCSNNCLNRNCRLDRQSK